MSSKKGRVKKMEVMEDSSNSNEDEEYNLNEDKRRIDHIKENHRKNLENMKEDQDMFKSPQERLQKLLDSASKYNSTVRVGNISPLKENAKLKRRKKMEIDVEEGEEEEDKTESSFITRWNRTPFFVKNGEMKDYQLAGLNWLIKLYDSGINGILADEMGLGKTLQTISLLGYLKHVRKNIGPHIIIAPKSTLINWLTECKRWVPTLDVFGFHGNKEERADLIERRLKEGNFNAVVTTYEIATREKSALRKIKWQYIVFDEAHRIKNEKSALSQVVRAFDSQNRLLITGTPLQNNLHELWALLNFLLPEVFSSSEDFDSWFDLRDEDANHEVINKLHKILSPFLLRRTKSEVAKGLPKKIETKLYIGMSAMQRELYQRILMKDIDLIQSNSRNNKLRLSNILVQLRKVCNHPYLFPGVEPTYESEEGEARMLIQNSGKMLLLNKLLVKLKDNGSRVLIFSQMTRLLDILEDYMNNKGYLYARIDGQTESMERQDQIDEFNSPGSPTFVFLLSTRAGGLGINLATADTVVLFDSDWNPQADLQAQDRVHRIGQTRTVNVYRFVTEGTVEEKIIERAEVKLKIDALVIQKGRLVDQNKGLTKEEIHSMIKFGADKVFTSKESTITDEEIDTILGKGAQKTLELNEKLKLNNNSFDSLSFSEPNFDIWTFEGESYKSKKEASINQFLSVPKRERKKPQYNESMYFKSVIKGVTPPVNRKVGLRIPKIPKVYPHQFYPARYSELVAKEREFWNNMSERYDQAVEKGENLSEFENLENHHPLTPAEEKERDSLINKGFGEWGKRDFYSFLKGCERFGRNSYSEIAEQMETKTKEEVKKYANAFWKNYKEIPEMSSKIQQIEKGEAKLQRHNTMIELLSKQIQTLDDPHENLKISYKTKPKVFTEEEDKFLLVTTYECGYGNWEEIHRVITASPKFKFNWFFRTRIPAQLQQRFDILIRMIQREALAQENTDPELIPPRAKKVSHP